MAQSDVRETNNSTLATAIADFFHCNNIPDAVVESPEFKRVVALSRTVDKSFQIPNRRQIGGDLLELNYKNRHDLNSKDLAKWADLYGLMWSSDGCTARKMPFINVLCTNGVTPPIVVGIHDCSNHMAAGGKKDAEYIAKLMERHVEAVEKDKKNTDLFVFDGASNVQKAGKVLATLMPRATVLQGGEHVISLFFSDLACLTPIKVSRTHFYIHLLS